MKSPSSLAPSSDRLALVGECESVTIGIMLVPDALPPPSYGDPYFGVPRLTHLKLMCLDFSCLPPHLHVTTLKATCIKLSSS